MKEDELETSDYSKDIRFSEILKSWRTALFEVFYFLYSQHSNKSRAQNSQNLKIFHLFVMALQGIHLWSLSLPCTLSSCDQFTWVSSAISMTRIDFLMAAFGVGLYYFYFTLSLVSTMVGAFFFLFVKALRHEQIATSKMRYLFMIPLSVLRALYIPSLCVMVAGVNYALMPSDFHYGNVLEVGASGLASVPFLLFAVGGMMIYNLFHYEQLITKRETDILARPYGWVEVFRVFCITAMIFSHFFLHELHSVFHLLLTSLLSCLLCGLYVYYMPFYNEEAVFSHASCFAFVFLGSVAQIVGIILKQGLALYLNIICFTPVSIVILKVLIKKRLLKLRTNLSFMDSFRSIYDYELAIRTLTLDFIVCKKAKDKKGKKNATLALKNCFLRMSKRYPHKKIVSIYEFIFVFTILKKEPLARIKLSKAFYGEDSLETCFLHHKYMKYLNDYSEEYIEVIDFIKFRALQEQLTEIDIEACKMLIVFLTELSKEKVEPKFLEHLCRGVYIALEDANAKGEELVKLYPNNRVGLSLVGTFINDIYNDEERGNELLRKADYLKNHYAHTLEQQKLTYFDEKIGIILVSTHLEKLGQIASIDKNAAAILEVNPSMVIGTEMASFLPQPWNHAEKYNEFLVKSLQACEVADPEYQFLINFQHFIVETKIYVKLAAVDSFPFMIYALKREKLRRECVYIDYCFEILTSSQGFATLAEYSETEILLSNLKVAAIIKDFENYIPSLLSGKIVKHKTPRTSTTSYLKLEDFSETGRLLYMTKSTDEMNTWDAEIASDFLSIESKKRISICFLPNNDPVGILKGNNSPRKQLKVVFNPEIEIKETQLNDFTAGNSDYRITKDEKVGDSSDKITEMTKEQIKDFIQKSNIIDLGSAEAGALFGKEEGKKKTASAGASVMSYSATSSIGFTTNKKAIQLYSGVTSSVNKFNFYLCLAMFLIIGSSLGMHFFVSDLSHRYIQEIQISSHAERRLLAFQLGMQTREFTLAQFYSGNTEEIGEGLLYTLALFKELNSKLRTQASQIGNSEIQDVFYHDDYLAWEKTAAGILSSVYNLQNLIDNLERHTDTFLESQSTESAFYLYRNAIGETYNALNHSYSEIARVEQEVIFQYSNYCLLFMGCSLLLLVLCLIFVIMPNLRAIENNNRKVWKIFFKIPLDTVLEIKGKCEERLENFHAVEFLHENNEKLFSKMESRDKLKASRKFGTVIVPVILYYAITVVYLVSFYFLVYTEVFSTLQVWHEIANLAAIRVEAVNSAYFWTQEQKQVGTSMSYFDIVSEGQIFVDPVIEAKKSIELLRYSEKQLLGGKLGRLKNDEHFKILFQRVDSEVPLLHMGVHSALQIFIDDILYTVDTVTQSTNLSKLKAQADALVDSTMHLRRLYDVELKALAAKTDNLSLLAILVFSVAMLAMYMIVLVPTLMRVKNKIKMIWKMGSIIPISQRNKILLSIK